jgi:hypothetical protein
LIGNSSLYYSHTKNQVNISNHSGKKVVTTKYLAKLSNDFWPLDFEIWPNIQLSPLFFAMLGDIDLIFGMRVYKYVPAT